MSALPLDPPARLDVMEAAGTPPRTLRLSADVVVVGSGAGGAVVAYEMAAAGRRVVLLEAGPYVPSREFTERYADSFAHLYQDAGGQTNTTGDLLVLQGRCLGGSTVVNAAAAFRTPERILAAWRREHGLSELTAERLDPFFQTVERRLSVHVNEPHEINETSRRLQAGCAKLGYSTRPIARNIKNCALSGFCIAGCASDRKQSMLVTYIPWAIHAGATVICDTTVESIRVEGGRARGVAGVMRERGSNRAVATVDVTAKVVVLAAGAIQTPLLLLKQGLANRSGMVGKNFACHPSFGVLGRFRDAFYGWRGATLGSYCDEFDDPQRGGFIFEFAMAGADFFGPFIGGVGREYGDWMGNLAKIGGMISLIHDRNGGEVRLGKVGKEIHYALDDRDKPTLRRCLKEAARIFFAAGAEAVLLPTYVPATITDPGEIERRVDALGLRPLEVKVTSYHPQGTCRMGADPATSVVAPDGQTHDVEGLYVADASLFPTSIMVNPQMTVYALASLIADGLQRDPRGHFRRPW